MYRDKSFRERALDEVLEDISAAATMHPDTNKVFVADGDSLVLGMDRWRVILPALDDAFPHLRRVSCYATAGNILEKTEEELRELREGGLSLLYIGPESGDPETLRRIVKGASFRDHAMAADRAHGAGMKLSVIFLLGAGGTARGREHALASAHLITEMNPEYLSALTLTVIPGTPQARMLETGRFELPSVPDLLRELRIMVAESRPSRALLRTNHASNYLPLEGRLPRDRERILSTIDAALTGQIPLRPEYWRGL
jgi:radical SAM superfamily enzyme YgiQ (UPF0313 family)